MNDKQRRRFERLSRVSAFMAEHASSFPQATRGAQAAARLNNVIAELEALDSARVAKRGEKQQATAGRGEARASLRAQLTTISETAETIGLDHPEMKGAFRWSRAGMSDQTLLATARAFAENAKPHEMRFVEYDLPLDFLDKLDASIAAFDQYINRQTQTAASGVATTASLEDALRRGDEEVERIETSVNNKFGDDPARMAAWESASRLERAPRRPPEPTAAATLPAKP